MGLIGWIKKEIESSSRHRRQSAPAPIIQSLTSPNGNRDEAYLRAVAKFNEWRNNQRFERLNETKNTSEITERLMNRTADTMSLVDDVSITDVEVKEDERERLVQSRRLQNSNKKKQAAVYSNYNPAEISGRNKRFSLPNMHATKNSSDRSERRKVITKMQPTNTIDEIEEFEQNHCREFENFAVTNPSTPPQKFFRANSEPFNDKKPAVVDTKKAAQSETRKPRRLMGRNMLRRNKGKAPPPPTSPATPVRSDATESTANFYNGNFKHYEVSSASVYDEYVISSKAYKGKMRKERSEKINSVGESASSGSLSSESEKNKCKRRQSPPYQTVINKHGDEVEYALPYNERDSLSDIPPLPTAPMPSSNSKESRVHFDQIIDQNFKFLNSKSDFLHSQIDNKASNSTLDPIDASFSDVRRQNLQVTDLDRSNEVGLAFPTQTGDIFKDLDALSKWTQNYRANDQQEEAQSPLETWHVSKKGVKTIAAKDLKYKSGSLRNSFSTPLEFSNGYFHKTPITLRSTLPNNYSINNFADIACMREFEILCKVKHFSVVTLMGASYDMDLRVTSLVMEPFDYTLNHYLHQMDKFYNIQQTVSLVHQIASATQYLNECGYVHSNISSHAVLIRDHPFAVKLSSFELSTEILPRESIGKIYRLQNINENGEIFSLELHDLVLREKYTKLSKQHFYNRTSLPVAKMSLEEYGEESEYRQQYSIPFRRMFSMHYYQAPELLIPTTNTENLHVFPSPQSDVYGLALLLWESINRAVPFVIYNNDELIGGLKNGNIQLPMLDKSSIIFKEIFDKCLHVNSSMRLSDVYQFITMLEDLRLLGFEKNDDKIEVLEIIEPTSDYNGHKTEKNIKNSDQRDKLREKIYFSHTENDLQKRQENALTAENLRNIPDVSKVSVQSAEIEPQMNSFLQPPGILQDDVLERIRRTVEDQRAITPKKPTRKSHEDHPLEMSKNSTMFQSFFDFHRLQTPKVDKDVVYERTSTLKKRLKPNAKSEHKKSVKGLFEKDDNAEKQILNDQFEKMNAELNLIIQDYNKNDFMQEIVNELQHREKSKATDCKPATFLNQRMAVANAHEMSRSFENLTDLKSDDNKRSKVEASPVDQRRYSTDDSFSMPNTPIARQNMIRRNAWLSEGNKAALSSKVVSDEVARRSLSFINNSPTITPVNSAPKMNGSGNTRKQYNVNIKIHHNDLDSNATPKDKSTNLNQSQNNSSTTNNKNNSSVKIKLYNSASKPMPIIKVNNVDLNKTSYSEDINKKYYPMMPEMLSDVIQNKRERSSFLITTVTSEEPKEIVPLRKKSLSFSENHKRNDEDDVEEKVIVPLQMSVRETIKLLENNFSPSTNKQARVAPVCRNETSTTGKKSEETQADDFKNATKSADAEKRKNEDQKIADDGVDCLLQASESIQRLDELIANVAPKPLNMQVEAIANQANISNPTPKKITTKVTVNLKQISGRSSDVSQLKRIQSENTARHSVCNSTELIKRLHAHLKGKEATLGLNCKNGEISASCDSLVSKHCNEEMTPADGKRAKYFCRNCGFTMIPTEILQKLRNQERNSIASSIADNLQSIKYDESLQSLTAIRKWQQIAEAGRSTEDLYIDDDFCQGITQSLAANMELLPTPDFFDSLDFNILSAEIFHTQEHEFDDTLTEGEKLFEIEDHMHAEGEKTEAEKETEVLMNDEQREVPICDDDKTKQDEPKVAEKTI